MDKKEEKKNIEKDFLVEETKSVRFDAKRYSSDGHSWNGHPMIDVWKQE